MFNRFLNRARAVLAAAVAFFVGLLPDPMEQAIAGFEKSRAKLGTVIDRADLVIENERAARIDLHAAVDASFDREDSAYDAKFRAKRIRQRIDDLLA